MLLVVGIICLVVAAGMELYANLALKKNRLNLVKRPEKTPSFAILIPARYESRVIGGLLKSIQRQTVKVKMSDVYVIVEAMDDPTVEICREYGCNVILRQKMKLQRKGYALDEAVKQILQKKHYDLYSVFDADNRMSTNYIKEMLEVYAQGYQMATGYRNAKNNNRNIITAASALTFTMINTIGNKNRIRHQANIIFSGTGCFIDGQLIEKWHGWPFHSLTEDYEMSLYAILHGIPTFYNEKAVFYDEQPTQYRQTVDQRVRWIKGYFMSRKKYIPLIRKRRDGRTHNAGSLTKEIVGVKPIIWLLAGLSFILLDGLLKICFAYEWRIVLLVLIGILVALYIVLAVFTLVMMKKEKMSFNRRIKVLTVLYNPIYLLSYVPCAFRAILTKNVTWKRIEHGEKASS